MKKIQKEISKMKAELKPTLPELARQALSSVEKGYDLLAPKFDNSRYITPDSIIVPFFDRIVQETGIPKNGIDICCGTGAASISLSKLCSESFTAVDLSQGMLNQCRNKVLAQQPSAALEFIKANALDLPFDTQFDVAVSFGAFGHILEADQDKFIASIHRSLESGGDFYFITTGKLPLYSISLWRQRIFNGMLRIRNFLFSPKFIMYYLTFRLPEVKHQLEQHGFEVEVLDERFHSEAEKVSDLMPLKYFRMVKARKK